MKDEEISINGLAQMIQVPANRLSLIVNGKRRITADTSARLGRYFVVVHPAEVELCGSIALVGGPAEPLGRLGKVSRLDGAITVD